MPLRELLFGASVDTVVPTTFMVGPTLATILHTVETALTTRLHSTQPRADCPLIEQGAVLFSTPPFDGIHPN